MNEPRTASGRDLLEVLSFRSRRRWGTLVWIDSVQRIEAEARDETLQDLRRRAEGLGDQDCRAAVLALLASTSAASEDHS